MSLSRPPYNLQDPSPLHLGNIHAVKTNGLFRNRKETLDNLLSPSTSAAPWSHVFTPQKGWA